MAIKLGLSGSLTWITYKALENPLRIELNRQKRSIAAFAIFVLSAVIVVPVGFLIRSSNYIDASPAIVGRGGIAFDSSPERPYVVLVGDSEASMYARSLRRLCSELNLNLVVASSAGGDALPDIEGNDSLLWRNSLRLVEELEPDVVVFGGAWGEKLKDEPDKIGIAISELRKDTDHLIVLGQPPVLPQNVSRQGIREGARAPFFEAKEDAARRIVAKALIQDLQSDDVLFLDVEPLFVDETGAVAFVDGEGRLLFHDSKHLSGFGADRVMSLLKSFLADVSRASSSEQSPLK